MISSCKVLFHTTHYSPCSGCGGERTAFAVRGQPHLLALPFGIRLTPAPAHRPTRKRAIIAERTIHGTRYSCGPLLLELLVTARPFLKWAGGKGQLLPALTSRLPDHFARYHEPFMGGGAFFFSLWSNNRLAAGALLSDYNGELIDCYKVVRDDVEALIELLEVHKAHTSDKEYFYEVRKWDRLPDFAHDLSQPYLLQWFVPAE
jgi:hypothetical protein